MNNYKIAIIDDDEITSLNLKISLQKYGYDVVCICDNAHDAFEEVTKTQPDILIIDISLQDSNDGIELAKRIKEKYDIPFIYLSSHSNEDIIEQAKQTKPYGYIVKPFNPNSIHATLQMALVHYSSNEEEARENDLIEQSKKLLEAKATENETVTFAKDYMLDLNANKCYYKNKELRLSDAENAFLTFLVSHLGLIVTYEQVAQYIENEIKESVSIRSLAWRLKNKLDTDIIKDAEGIGYFIEA